MPRFWDFLSPGSLLSLLLCWSAFYFSCSAFLCFVFPAFLLLCFSCFSAFLASLLYCFSVSVPFCFYSAMFFLLRSCDVMCFAALLPAPLLLLSFEICLGIYDYIYLYMILYTCMPCLYIYIYTCIIKYPIFVFCSSASADRSGMVVSSFVAAATA